MKFILRFSAVVAAFLAIATVGGCGTAGIGTGTTYSYEPQFSFPGSKTYRWANAKPTYPQDPLLEANVRFLADRALEAKGFTSPTDKADLIVGMGYEVNSYGSAYGDELRALTLYISRAENNELVWRGTARGAIRTDAASGELKQAVGGILVNFPPK